MTQLDHGARATYTAHLCRCTQCRAANARYERNRRRHGTDRVGAGTTRITINIMLSKMSKSELARRSGINRTTLTKISNGTWERIAPGTVLAIDKAHTTYEQERANGKMDEG